MPNALDPMLSRIAAPAFVEVSKADANGLPDAAIKLLHQARAALQRRDLALAERTLTLCLAHAPSHSGPNRLLGLVYQCLGRLDLALSCLRAACKTRPNDASIVIPMMQVLADSGDVDAAIRGLRELVRVEENVSTLAELADLLGRHGYLEEAIVIGERVLSMDPAQTRTRLRHALNLFHDGFADAARGHFRHLIDAQHELAGAWFGLAEMKEPPFDNSDLHRLRKLCDRERSAGRKRALLLHALGKACEDNGEWPDAMAAFTESARINRAAMRWNQRVVDDQLAQLRAAFSAPHSFSTADFGSEVIFIVGMPRSGSTLIEQILASHAHVAGGSELLDLPDVLKHESRMRKKPYPQWVGAASAEDWRRLGADYLQRTSRWREHKPRSTDKYHVNWMAAEIVLAMLPGARIIECRRDPLEMLWSCFKQCFAPGNAPWSYDYDDLVAYWRACSQQGDYLAARYPDRVRIQSYERLLEDSETQIGELLRFCKLPFDAACLRPDRTARAVRTPSAAQVRHPIRRARLASECYGQLLDPLRRKLAID